MPQKNNNQINRLDYTSVSRQNKRQVYRGFFSVEEHKLSYKKFDGSQSEVVTRSALVSSEAVIVLPYDPVNDRVLNRLKFQRALMTSSKIPSEQPTLIYYETRSEIVLVSNCPLKPMSTKPTGK